MQHGCTDICECCRILCVDTSPRVHICSGWQDGMDWSPARTAAVIPSKDTANTWYAFRDISATAVQRRSMTRLEQYFTTPTYHYQNDSSASVPLPACQ